MKPQRVAVRKGKLGERAREGRVYDAIKLSKEQYSFILIKQQNSHCLLVLSTSSFHYHLTNLFSVPFFLRNKISLKLKTKTGSTGQDVFVVNTA